MTPVILYAVALKDTSSEPLAPAVFLTGSKGYTKDSARAFARSQPGYLGRRLSLEDARALQAAALAAGFETIIAAEAEIPPLPPAIKIAKIDLEGTGFSATSGGILQFVNFADVSLLAAAAFDAPVPPLNLDAIKKDPIFEKIMTLAGDPPFRPVSESGSRETFFRADIIAENGLLHLQLQPENLDFSPLGAGRSHSSLINFRELLKQLSLSCGKAVNNAFLAAFLAGSHLAPLKLAGPQACDAELSRLLLVSPRKPRTGI